LALKLPNDAAIGSQPFWSRGAQPRTKKFYEGEPLSTNSRVPGGNSLTIIKTGGSGYRELVIVTLSDVSDKQLSKGTPATPDSRLQGAPTADKQKKTSPNYKSTTSIT
ncbi:hypothetical protein PV325_013003, partial [Microctonus aethiopoides]